MASLQVSVVANKVIFEGCNRKKYDFFLAGKKINQIRCINYDHYVVLRVGLQNIFNMEK